MKLFFLFVSSFIFLVFMFVDSLCFCLFISHAHEVFLEFFFEYFFIFLYELFAMLRNPQLMIKRKKRGERRVARQSDNNN